jgi:hypothetical protein
MRSKSILASNALPLRTASSTLPWRAATTLHASLAAARWLQSIRRAIFGMTAIVSRVAAAARRRRGASHSGRRRAVTRVACVAFAAFFAPFLGAQSTRGREPAHPRCYRLSVGEWSRPLGVNAAYHAIPPIVRLDTVPVADDGWSVAPDIAFPTGGRFPGMPRWTQQGDSIRIVWSSGYQGTTVRLGPWRREDLRGIAPTSSPTALMPIAVALPAAG